MLASSARRTLLLSCAAHATHDGYSDLIYILLPVWQVDFALGYTMLAVFRGLYSGAMASLQIPAGRLATRFGIPVILAAGTLLAAVGYLIAGASTGLVGLCVALTIAGAGSSVQHPLASSAVSRAFSPHPRAALGTYNFSGDLGKAAVPALVSLLLSVTSWRRSIWITAIFGVVMAVVIAIWMPRSDRFHASPSTSTSSDGKAEGNAKGEKSGRLGFVFLLIIGMLDTGVRMGLLTFLPFLLKAKGATLPTVGAALAMLFVGGAAGKFVCGWLGSRVGVLWTVLLTEGGTAACIVATLFLPLPYALVLMPVLGVMLNGTSSVLYGTVPELAPPHQTERAFAVFYTFTLGSGALSPVVFGALGDAVGPQWASAATAIAALLTLPLALALMPHLSPASRSST